MRRIDPVRGEWIARDRPLSFSFEGRTYGAYEGDTVSSALAASGVAVLGRSFKYHRPRGLMSFANHDVNALVQVTDGARSIPNVRADVTRVRQGWNVRAVNTRGGLANDRLAVLDRLSRFLPVGFYYKDFYDHRTFPRWERLFRRTAGLGAIDPRAARAPSAKRYEFADVVVIGAGPSGLAAALAAARRGADVLLVDENPRLGGSAGYAPGDVPASEIDAVLDEVRSSGIRILTGTCAVGCYADHWIALDTPAHMIKVRARAMIVAQGALEQPAVFRGNDLPGVMLASGAQRLLYRYAVAPASRVGVLTANSAGYAAAFDALDHGIRVAGVFDLRAAPGAESAALSKRLAARGVPVYLAVKPREAHRGAAGRVQSFSFEDASGRTRRCELDGLWSSVGFAPAHALLLEAGAKLRYERALEQFVPDALPAGIYACGKSNGVYGFANRLADGRYAGARAAADLGLGPQPEPLRLAAVEPPTHPYPVFPHREGKEFVDFDEDLQVRDLEQAFREGFDSSELLKRYSTVGMGPSQGKHSNANALRILARLRGEEIGQVGQTTARPMFHPVRMSHLAGRGFAPERRTPLDAEHARHGAVWMPAGNWRRPEYYARDGLSRAEAITQEVHAVRSAVGLIDVGTLGKIEAYGPHAAEFLERVYTGRFASLKVGMTRYGLMLDEAGVVIDDGVIARVEPEAFYFTTTTGNSATLFREFGRLATWWRLPVGLVNLTGHYAAFNLAGPSSRALLRTLTALDLSNDAFPYLGVRTAQVAGVPCRLMRVGFVGELGFELHMPAARAILVWQALMDAGKRFGLRLFGVEAQRMLRLEKGHIIVGQDTDGLTSPLEIGAQWALKMDKPFFVGQRSVRILERQPLRQTLIGFTLDPAESRRPRECHLVIEAGEIAGRVTSTGYSPTLGRCIGLAFVTPAVASRGTFRIRIERGELLDATIAPLPFYDAASERQKVEAAA